MIDPAVLFFLVGIGAQLLRTELRLPDALRETLSIYLLLAIGLKGGTQLANADLGALAPQVMAALALGAGIPLVAYPVLRRALGRPDAASIAGHFGSVSVVTFAAAQAFLDRQGVKAEATMPLILALMEVPGILVGVAIARARSGARTQWPALLHEVLCGKSVYLLLAGVTVGAIIGPQGMVPLAPVFIDAFRGVLCLFLLELGLEAARQFSAIRRSGAFLIGFGVLAPPVFALAGALAGHASGLSVGGTMLLATLAGSASYIAAPAAMRIAVPEANPGLSVGLVLGITFPFNLSVGIPLYWWMAQQLAA